MSSTAAEPPKETPKDSAPAEVDIGEDVAARDAASEFRNCIRETLSIVRNVSVKKKSGAKETAVEADKS